MEHERESEEGAGATPQQRGAADPVTPREAPEDTWESEGGSCQGTEDLDSCTPDRYYSDRTPATHDDWLELKAERAAEAHEYIKRQIHRLEEKQREDNYGLRWTDYIIPVLVMIVFAAFLLFVLTL